MALADRWGIPFFYASKDNGFFYQQSDSIKNDSNFIPPSGTTYSGEEFTIHFQGPTSGQIVTHNSFTDLIGGCNMSFADSVARGYTYKTDDVRDIEVKFLMSVVDGGDHGFSLSGPTGHHASSGCCQGFAYMINLEYNTNPVDFRFRKEMWHVSYHTDPVTDVWNHPLANFKLMGHGYVGLGYCRYNKHNTADPKDDTVILECWFNPDPTSNITGWTMLKRTEDKGGWGDDGARCDGDKDQIGTWAGPKFRMKSNDPDAHIKFKHLSLREIDPLKGFDDNPQVPPPIEQPPEPTEVQGQFVFKWDLNQYRTSPCAGTSGGGGGGGLAIVYDVDASSDRELSDSSTFQNRIKVFEIVTNSSSPLHGVTPQQVDIPLKKAGSPGSTPLITAKIWNSNGTLVYQSPTSYAPNSLTSSFVKKTFNFSTNTHSLVTGDRIGVDWRGTSDTNYVLCGYDDSNPIPNSQYANYEGSEPPDIKTGRDFACTIWE